MKLYTGLNGIKDDGIQSKVARKYWIVITWKASDYSLLVLFLLRKFRENGLVNLPSLTSHSKLITLMWIFSEELNMVLASINGGYDSAASLLHERRLHLLASLIRPTYSMQVFEVVFGSQLEVLDGDVTESHKIHM